MRARTLFYLAWTVCAGLPLLLVAILLAQGKAAQSALIAPIAVVLFSLAAVPFFVMGLKQFKRGLRGAFGFINAGIILYALAQLQFPLATIFDLGIWINSGGIILPYIASVTLLLIGIARFGRLLQLRNRWFKLRWAYLAATAVAILSSFIPHPPIPLAEMEFDISIGLNNWVITVVAFAAISTWKIRNVAADRFKNTLNWLFASLALLALSAFHYAVVSYVAMTSWYANSPFMYTFMLISAISFMQAAYAFTRVTTFEAAQPQANSPVDVIMYVAGMASRPTAIDPLLDTLRRVTSTTSGKGLSAAQETELAKLYQQLEGYLIGSEPLQKITASGLREAVRNRFQFSEASTSTFWSLFKEKAA